MKNFNKNLWDWGLLLAGALPASFVFWFLLWAGGIFK